MAGTEKHGASGNVKQEVYADMDTMPHCLSFYDVGFEAETVATFLQYSTQGLLALWEKEECEPYKVTEISRGMDRCFDLLIDLIRISSGTMQWPRTTGEDKKLPPLWEALRTLEQGEAGNESR